MLNRQLSKAFTIFRYLYYLYTEISLLKIVKTKKDLKMFWPNSAGSIREKKFITYNTLRNLIPILGRFSDRKVSTLSEFKSVFTQSNNSGIIGELLKRYGSDKSTTHNYDLVYELLFSNPSEVNAVLEIGIGSPNLKIVSNMGDDANPGASLKAFRDFYSNAEIWGADIDEEILFKEERIRTFMLNQLDDSSFEKLIKNVDSEFDLVIDDGLHSIDANMNVLHFFIPMIRSGGYVIIEDIPEVSVPFWQIFMKLLDEKGRSWLIELKGGFLLVFKKY